MTVIPLITVPNRLLRQKSKPVKTPKNSGEWDKKTKAVINDLLDTVKAQQDPEGVGLSAIQIGKPLAIFVAKIDQKFEVFINPKIIWKSVNTNAADPKSKRPLEGCLSIPNLYGLVNRPVSIKLTWINLAGQKKRQLFTLKPAIFLQHEYDHLHGILFTDRILAQKGKIYELQKNADGKDELVEMKIE